VKIQVEVFWVVTPHPTATLHGITTQMTQLEYTYTISDHGTYKF